MREINNRLIKLREEGGEKMRGRTNGVKLNLNDGHTRRQIQQDTHTQCCLAVIANERVRL